MAWKTNTHPPCKLLSEWQEEAAARRLQRERTLREQEEKAIEMAKAMTAASQAAEDAVARAAAAEAAAAKEANHAVHALELAAAEEESEPP